MAKALGKLSPDSAASQTDIRNLIDRVVIGHATIRIQLSEVAEEPDSARILTLPWTRPSPYRKREIIQGANDAKTYARPMPANARAILIEALRDAHRWLGELLSDPRLTLELLASREGKTIRWIRMTLSLAFLAPEIVKAAVEGRLPRGFGQASRRPADGLAGSVGRAQTPNAGAASAHLAPGEGLIHPSQPGQASGFEPPTGVRNRARWTRGKQQPWKRKFTARDFRQDAPGIALRIVGPPTETDP